ncbi:MAG TPA: hypothetical protein VFW23_17015, partial [Tepidisphaeraceae bacterium]|nr:hypothetical protein [Tepidisphaeraceae bacterium]
EQQGKPSVERRKENRMTYRRGHMRLRVTRPGGGSVERVVIGRAISAHGAGVLVIEVVFFIPTPHSDIIGGLGSRPSIA